jgi:hypothetical protein
VSVHLEAVRFFATTSSERGAGTDDGVSFRYNVDAEGLNSPPAGVHTVRLDHGWNDRQRGRTEMYEIEFRPGEEARSRPGTDVAGIQFRDFDGVMRQRFELVMEGNDAWKIDHYYVLGRFAELEHVSGTIDEFRRIDHGWILIARREGDITLSTDSMEGISIHRIRLNVNPRQPQTRT